jgi:hypothetical protein
MQLSEYVFNRIRLNLVYGIMEVAYQDIVSKAEYKNKL